MALLLILVLFIGLTGLSGCTDQKSNNSPGESTKMNQTNSSNSTSNTNTYNSTGNTSGSGNNPSAKNNSTTNHGASKDYIMYKGVKYTIVDGWNHSDPCPYCGVLDREMVGQVEHKGYLFYVIHCNNCGKNYAV